MVYEPEDEDDSLFLKEIPKKIKYNPYEDIIKQTEKESELDDLSQLTKNSTNSTSNLLNNSTSFKLTLSFLFNELIQSKE